MMSMTLIVVGNGRWFGKFRIGGGIISQGAPVGKLTKMEGSDFILPG